MICYNTGQSSFGSSQELPNPNLLHRQGEIMAEPITLALVLGAAIGGATEALVGKSADALPATQKRIRRAVCLVEQRTPTEMEEAVARAVDAARRDLRQEAIDGFLDADEATLTDLIALLDHRPFAEAVAAKLIYRGQPDFERLRNAYIKQEGNAASERWLALEMPLTAFFQAIESHLQVDPQMGTLIGDLQMLANVNGLAESQRIVADAAGRIEVYQRRISAAAETNVSGIQALVELSGRQDVKLGQLVELMAAALDALGADGRHTASLPLLSAAERRYLHALRYECNKMPLSLAQDARGQTGRHARPTELAHVYINLETERGPTLKDVQRRLNISDDDSSGLSFQFLSYGRDKVHDGASLQEEIDQLLFVRAGENFDDHPLRPWVENKSQLNDALCNITALEALVHHRRLVLLGNPGSGKSTFVNHLAYALAGGLLDDEPDWLDRLEGRFDAPCFPIRVILRTLSGRLTPESRPGAALILDALCELDEGLDRGNLEEWLQQPQTIVFFDGLDEAPPADPDDEDGFDRRRIIVESVRAFCAAFPKPATLVTSRIRAYESGPSNGAHVLEDLPTFRLALLDEGRVAKFVERWHEEVARVDQCTAEQASIARERLSAALDDRPILREMAGVPLLLTMLARVNLRGRLPEGRAEAL
jgi:hypothetical protein